jgi:methionyl-tRNA synthetase
VLNAWAEGMPASMYCTAYAQRLAGEDPTSDDELWRAGRAGGDIDLVYFLGFDNAYFWGLTHLALLMAHEGRYVLPSTIVCNEFYELENEKFSTSKGHVVWARDLARDVPRDLARFYLARTAPENARTNFSRAGLAKITRDCLTTPWNRLSATLDKVIADLGAAGAELPVSAAARSRVATMTARFATCYELAGFSLTRVADMITGHVQRLDTVAAALAATVAVDDRDVALARLGDLCHEVRALVTSAAPILIDLADAVGPAPADGTTRALGLPPLPEPPGA